MRRPKKYSLQQLSQMFAVFGVDLAARWGEVATTEQAAEVWRSSKAEAKQRYRSMAMELHPDRNPEPQAADQMAEVNQLWSIIDGLTPTFRQKPPPPPPPQSQPRSRMYYDRQSNPIMEDILQAQRELRRREVAEIFRGGPRVTVVRVSVDMPTTDSGTTDDWTAATGTGKPPF